jgi:hypothetical protein
MQFLFFEPVDEVIVRVRSAIFAFKLCFEFGMSGFQR